MEITTRHYCKRPNSGDDIIALLSSRGLIVRDKLFAKRELKRIGYYRLSAYCIPFEMPSIGQTRCHRFKAGTAFEDIVNLYTFDCELRALVFSAIESIEVSLRSAFANELALVTGDAHAHLLSQYFDEPKYGTNLKALLIEVARNKEAHIEHYRREYHTPDTPPIWLITEVMSMGVLSKWVSSLNVSAENRIKPNIALMFGFEKYDFLDSFMRLLTIIRNKCAHHSRLFNVQLAQYIKLKSAPEPLKSVLLMPDVDQFGANYGRKLYNMWVLIAHVLEISYPQSHWKYLFVDYISSLESKFSSAQARSILYSMGFPTNWREMAFWQRGFRLNDD